MVGKMERSKGVSHLPFAFSLLTFRIPVRRELRYALLAAMETCWVYAIIAFLGALTLTPTISPLSLFAAYWIALLVGRVLPRLQSHLHSTERLTDGVRSAAQVWRTLQLATLGIGLLTLLIIVRVEVFGAQVSLLDVNWLPRYLVSFFSLREGIPGAFLATLGVLYMFLRGLGFAQRPLTLWFIGFQFRLGLVAFFLVLIASAMLTRYDATLWIFLYFFLGLLAIALARMDEIGSAISLGPRWVVTLLTAVVLVILFGLVLLQFFTLDAANWLLVLLAPVFMLFATLLFLLLIPAGIVAEWLLNFMEPFLRQLGKALDALKNVISPEAAQPLQPMPQPNPAFELVGSAAKILFVALLMVGVGLLLAKALNRRMLQIEQETYVREAVGAEEEDGRVRESGRRKRANRRRGGDIIAETIRRIYAALVARANGAGLPRRVAETPYEFLPRLQEAWPNEANDLQEITEAYIAVHYGEHAASAEEVGLVRSAWRRVQAGIRRKT